MALSKDHIAHAYFTGAAELVDRATGKREKLTGGALASRVGVRVGDQTRDIAKSHARVTKVDDTRFATASAEGLALWSVAKSKPLAKLKLPKTNVVPVLAASPGRLAANDGETVSIFAI